MPQVCTHSGGHRRWGVWELMPEARILILAIDRNALHMVLVRLDGF